ncbi:MAG: nicotinamide-nucleotide amidohydrolase family protein [Desulfatiglans sp.]|jgi:nicotinamide-nucleotide amidase|nr:nicotinamide-nucleotide amidohydrolase family protein [Desulfatiglans sp.]
MEKTLGNILIQKSLTIATAESCTGGLIGHMITSIPGSSAYFMGGIISYSNQAKCDLLGVSADTLKKYGAVSGETAREMAWGIRERFGTDIGLSVTGIAGPDGGTKEKPVGTVFMGFVFDKKEPVSIRYLFKGTREKIKQKTAETALENIRRYLDGDTFIPGI